MKKLLTLILLAATVTGCTLGPDGEFVSSGSDSTGEAGYSSTPSYIQINIASKDELDCVVEYTNLDTGDLLDSFEMKTSEQHELKIVSADHLFRLTSTCSGEFINSIEFNAMGSHYLGVDQSITLSIFSNLATAYYQFYSLNADIEGQEYVFVQAAKKTIGDFFGLDDINVNPDFSGLKSNELVSLDNNSKYTLLLDGFMTLHSSLINDTALNAQSFNEMVVKDLFFDGKLDGQNVTLDQIENLVLNGDSQSYDVNTYTYVNEYIVHLTKKYGHLMKDQDIRSSFFNMLDSRNSDRGPLLRNEDIVLLDSSAPTITSSEYSIVDGTITITANASDDFLISRLNLSFEDLTFDMIPEQYNEWTLSLNLEDTGLTESDFDDYDLTARDYFENVTTVSF